MIGGPATILSTLLANLVRAEGKAGQASFGLSLGGAANLVLDPLFILPQFLGLGAVGAGHGHLSVQRSLHPLLPGPFAALSGRDRR